MSIDRETAASALSAIRQTEERTSQAIFYGIASWFLILWGAITVVGYSVEQFCPRYAATVWSALQLIGFAATAAMVALRYRSPISSRGRLGWRLLAAQVALAGFAILAMQILPPLSGRQMDAFLPLVFMLGYVLVGIWIGRFFLICGIAVALLTVAGYWWSGPWFPLCMAAVNGGALILGGLWLHHKGAAL